MKIGKNMIENTEQATQLYADAWNSLDFNKFYRALHDDCHYSSQYVLAELESREKIIAYLNEKIETIKKSGHKVVAKVATLNTGASLNPPAGSPCVAIFQGESCDIAAVVFFEISDEKIQRIDLCMPELYNVIVDGTATLNNAEV